MDFEKLINTRQSCRNFDGEKQVSAQDIQSILEAARIAPSACNAQEYKFTVCSGQAAKDAADCLETNKFAKNASCLIIISEAAYNITAYAGSKIKGQDFRSIDIGIAAAHITLAATERGLASCIIGYFNEKKLKKLFNINSRIRLVIALGHAAEDYKIREKKRKSQKELFEYYN